MALGSNGRQWPFRGTLRMSQGRRPSCWSPPLPARLTDLRVFYANQCWLRANPHRVAAETPYECWVHVGPVLSHKPWPFSRAQTVRAVRTMALCAGVGGGVGWPPECSPRGGPWVALYAGSRCVRESRATASRNANARV